MPELPEVETVKTALHRALAGTRIIGCTTYTEKLRYPLNLNNSSSFINSRIVCFNRRGRYLICELDCGEGLLIHLGMSGRLKVVDTKMKRLKHEHVVFNLENHKDLRFECPRKFGLIKQIYDLAEVENLAEIKTLGPEPISNKFSSDYLNEILENKKASIKSVLMDNLVVAGIGNIYVSEALFKAGVSPFSKSNRIPASIVKILVKSIKEVISAAINAGNEHIFDSDSVTGNEWSFNFSRRVYGRVNEPCFNCSNSHIVKGLISGRNSFYCPECQVIY